MKTEYDTKNVAVTGMSDDNFYGRETALNVDIEAATRAAVREARRAYQHIIAGDGSESALLLRRVVYRLAITLGNQSHAEESLYMATLAPLGLDRSAEEKRDQEELEKGVNRQHKHPGLAEALATIEARLAALR